MSKTVSRVFEIRGGGSIGAPYLLNYIGTVLKYNLNKQRREGAILDTWNDADVVL